MVRSPSPRSDSSSVADAARGGGRTSSQKASRSILIHGHVPKGARSESRRYPAAGRLAPQNAWASRARHVRARADLSAGLDNHTAASLSDPTTSLDDPSPVPAPSSQPSGQPEAAARAPSTMPVAAIACAAVGGVVVVVAAALALVYFFRIRRRVKTMKRCTDILGPELAPMSPSQSSSSRLSFDSMVKSDRTLILSPSTTSDPSKHFLPLAAPMVYPPATVDRPSQSRPSLRISTIAIGPPPTPRRGPILTPEPRSPMRSSRVTLSWPSPTSQSES